MLPVFNVEKTEDRNIYGMGSRSQIAKKKLKTHVRKYGKKDFDLTYHKMSYWFGVINQAAFRNSLPVPYFRIKRMPRVWGMCILNRDATYTIEINSTIKSRDLFISTLAHEMVHIWQQQTHKSMNHTGTFKEWSDYFSSNFGIDI